MLDVVLSYELCMYCLQHWIERENNSITLFPDGPEVLTLYIYKKHIAAMQSVTQLHCQQYNMHSS